ncbi:MAG: type II toxin-antitoxin system RelE/ParE family toxin [Gemmatimonadota bacterium]
MKIVWSPLAEQRALEAVDYIAQDRPLAAVAWLEALIERVGQLDRFARRGRIVPEIGRPDYRQIMHAPYRVVYRVDKSKIVILTIRHWRRDWDPAEIPGGE